MKKEILSPFFTFAAMIFIIISGIVDTNKPIDIITYIALIVALISVYQIYRIIKKLNNLKQLSSQGSYNTFQFHIKQNTG